MFHEISRKRINISKYEETSLKWHNSIISIRGNKNLHLIDFTYNLQTLEKGIDFKECTVSANYDSPLPKDFLQSYAARGLSNLELVEMITNPALWPHNKLLTQEMTNVVAFKWSPENLINNKECILATVNSVGNVELFGPKRQIWASILDFSKEMRKYLDNAFHNLYQCSKNFTDVQKAVYSIETCTICWAPELNADNSCYLITVQKSGDILFWSLKQDNSNLQTKFCGNITSCKNCQIVTITWVTMCQNKFMLISSNEFGQVMIIECEIVDEKVTLINKHTVWPYKDKMLVTYINYTFEDGNLLLSFNKHRHLILQLFDKSLKLLSQVTNNINDNRISCITQKQNEFYICTVNTKVYKLDYSVKNDTLDVSLQLIEIKDSYSNYELYGIDFSCSFAILALVLLDRRLLFRKESLKYHIAFLCYELDLEGYARNIIDNPTKTFTNIWDCIEILRCKVIKAKKMPRLDYCKLLQDGESDVYKLKTYLICLILYKNLCKMFSSGIKEALPETSMDVIKERILLFQAIKVIKNVHESYKKENQLNDFDRESFARSKRYLYYFCKKCSRNPNDLIEEQILNLNVPNIDVEYTCQGCENEISDFSCKAGHLNMFCSLTFTLIESDNYLVCKSCGATARAELMEQKPTCVFCDLYLTNSSLPF